ncbi:hypothetical protein GCM10010287_27650 [Streptomyces variabilis]|uniref:Large ribosomal subunit protein bL32 n=1 Tax=Streptomyces variabilis TaxID=67372 RepID=A0ABQ2TZN8_9ACTN|nr:hypothetical protein GCM10010265_56900 [Streptomyces griseoincarnatus]GGT52070.1 hypothetical protein GCM10010287_27650 [Streptomyces variabilis]
MFPVRCAGSGQGGATDGADGRPTEARPASGPAGGLLLTGGRPRGEPVCSVDELPVPPCNAFLRDCTSGHTPGAECRPSADSVLAREELFIDGRPALFRLAPEGSAESSAQPPKPVPFQSGTRHRHRNDIHFHVTSVSFTDHVPEVLMAVPKRKMSRSNTRHRRAQWKAVTPQLVTVTVDGVPHRVPQRLARAYERGLLRPEG